MIEQICKPNWGIDEWNLLINSIIAFSAIFAIIFSIATLRQTKKFKKDENLVRRAWILPTDQPGYMTLISINNMFVILS